MPPVPQKETLTQELNNREERFCYAFVNTGDKYKAFDIAQYEGKNQGAKAAAVSRLLKRPQIKARIVVLEREYYEALGIDEKRILGNVAEIAFDKTLTNKQDRLRALELLGKERAMWKDNQVGQGEKTVIVIAPRAVVATQEAQEGASEAVGEQNND